jgi:hypothetical protein
MKQVYCGEGEYDPITKTATYNVYLPKLKAGKGSYNIHHRKVYNFSCENDKNTILIFMEILGSNGKPDPALNTSLLGITTDPGETFTFQLENFTNIADDCIEIVCDDKPIIDVIIMHDYTLDHIYAKNELYMGNGKETFKKIDTNPKKHGFGTLRPSR